MTTRDFLLRLKGVRHNARGATALCPAHPDRAASLSIREGADQKILLHCFRGCEPEAIVTALGLSMADLFADSPNHDRRRPRASLYVPACPRPLREVDIQAAADLESIGVVNAADAWRAVRDYLSELKNAALRDMRSETRMALLLLHAKRDWVARGKPGWGPDSDDVRNALVWFEHTFITPDEIERKQWT